MSSIISKRSGKVRCSDVSRTYGEETTSVLKVQRPTERLQETSDSKDGTSDHEGSLSTDSVTERGGTEGTEEGLESVEANRKVSARLERESRACKTHSSLQDRDDVSLDVCQWFPRGGDSHITDESRLGDDSTSETGIVTEEDDATNVSQRQDVVDGCQPKDRYRCRARVADDRKRPRSSETHPM
jgi:hypothetical protein